MGQLAPRVCTESATIERLEAWIVKLPGNATVEVEYTEGAATKTVTGIVCVRPSVQSFRDDRGREGSNGILRLEVADAPGGEVHVWLDQIIDVRRRMAYRAA